MTRWNGASGGKLALWFSSVEDVYKLQEQLNQALNYLTNKYSDSDKKDAPILAVLDIDKFDETQYKSMDN